MALWVDKYRPLHLSKLDYHPSLSEQLERMSSSGDFPHLLMFGPSGAGKKTRVSGFLRNLYGNLSLKVEHRQFSFQKSSRTINVELTLVVSTYHIEMNPSEAGFRDVDVIQELVKQMAEGQSLSGKAKIIVIHEVERLSKNAQHALRKTMEAYMGTCRMILITNSTTKIIEAVRSRCLQIRVPAPSCHDIASILMKIGKKEGFSLDEKLGLKIAQNSERNLRQAILTLEVMKMRDSSLNPDSVIEAPDWEIVIQGIASDIVDEQSPQRLAKIRDKFYELLSHCVPAEVIIRVLTIQLLSKLDSEIKTQVVSAAAFFEHRIQTGSKAIFHLEAFTAQVMCIYKKFLINMFGF